jgi:hypothetical protein
VVGNGDWFRILNVAGGFQLLTAPPALRLARCQPGFVNAILRPTMPANNYLHNDTSFPQFAQSMLAKFLHGSVFIAMNEFLALDSDHEFISNPRGAAEFHFSRTPAKGTQTVKTRSHTHGRADKRRGVSTFMRHGSSDF